MIIIHTPQELHKVLARLDQTDAVWDLAGHNPSWLETELAKELEHADILLEMLPYYDPQGKKLITHLRWCQPITAEEYLKQDNEPLKETTHD